MAKQVDIKVGWSYGPAPAPAPDTADRGGDLAAPGRLPGRPEREIRRVVGDRPPAATSISVAARREG